MKKLKTVMVSAAAMVDIDNKVLIAQRQKDKFMADYWEFPGGKLEDGELPNQCLIREIQEELGVDISESCFTPITFTTYDYPDFSVIIYLYICMYFTNDTPDITSLLLMYFNIFGRLRASCLTKVTTFCVNACVLVCARARARARARACVCVCV